MGSDLRDTTLTGHSRRLAFLAFGIVLLVGEGKAQPCARHGRAHSGIRAELNLGKEKFKNDEPIIVDVYVDNSSVEDIRQNQFSPFSSSVGLPDFLITSLEHGERLTIPPGLFVDPPDWDDWYQPARGGEASMIGDFVLPAGKRIHLLQGDLRLMIEHARKYCQRVLAEEKSLMEKPDQATTKKEYEKIVRFAEQFLGGGSYQLTVCAYARSNTVSFDIERSSH